MQRRKLGRDAVHVVVLVALARACGSQSTSTLLGRTSAGAGTPQAITLGTGLAMSGTTLNASAAGVSPLTTKGDIWVYSSADTRLAVGANGSFLTADSGETTGLKWTTTAQFTELVQDAFAAMAFATDSISVSYDDGANEFTWDVVLDNGSLETTVNGIRLDGDEQTPGNDKYYGTDGGGTKGYHDLPTGGGGEGAAKGWCVFYFVSTILTLLDDFNVSSLTDNGGNDITVTWDTDFASGDYAAFPSAEQFLGSPVSANLESYAAGSIHVILGGDSAKISVVAFGDQ